MRVPIPSMSRIGCARVLLNDEEDRAPACRNIGTHDRAAGSRSRLGKRRRRRRQRKSALSRPFTDERRFPKLTLKCIKRRALGVLIILGFGYSWEKPSKCRRCIYATLSSVKARRSVPLHVCVHEDIPGAYDALS